MAKKKASLKERLVKTVRKKAGSPAALPPHHPIPVPVTAPRSPVAGPARYVDREVKLTRIPRFPLTR